MPKSISVNNGQMAVIICDRGCGAGGINQRGHFTEIGSRLQLRQLLFDLAGPLFQSDMPGEDVIHFTAGIAFFKNKGILRIDAAEFLEEALIDFFAVFTGLQQGFLQKDQISALVGRYELCTEKQDQGHIKDPDDQDNHRFQGAEDDIVAGIVGHIPGEKLFCHFHECRKNGACRQSEPQPDFNRRNDFVDNRKKNNGNEVRDHIAK